MKKPLIITLSIVLVIVVVGVILFSLINKDKPSITAEEFKSTMEEKGYYVKDVTAQFANYGYIKKPYVAASQDNAYQVEFYEISDSEHASKFFNTNKAIFEASKGSISAETNIGFRNYSKYTLQSNNKYQIVSRINSTVIFVDVDSKYKDTIDKLLNEIGY